MAGEKKKPLTQSDLDRAFRLDNVWEAVKAVRPITQKELALQMGVNHTTISQYIKGRIPLNIEAQLWFARYLRKSPVDIWPDFEFVDLIGRSDESLALLSQDDRAAVRDLIKSLSRKRA